MGGGGLTPCISGKGLELNIMTMINQCQNVVTKALIL